MRAVANGSNTHRSAFLALGARTAGTKFGMPERMSAKEWINRSTHASSMSASASSNNAGRSSASSTSSGSATSTSAAASFGSGKITSDKRVNGHTSKLGRTLDDKEEGKGKEREGVPRSSANSNPATTPNISENHDRVAHDGYYTRKNERTEQHNWQQRIKNAKPADYIKHTKARTAEEAKRMSETGERNAQYLPNFNRIELEQRGLRNGTLIKRDQSKGADYYICQFNEVIGYNNGQATQWIRVELTKTGKPEYHGHPISEVTAKQYLENLGN
ncbi:hypothetical protein [Candidatus Odyssella thessalonicensis]|uniref:hypothetical protein n=1 Tax=Candidatus Odyssella thessalonicensis TaxID=84647 RepID=UPI000225BFAE|nr:hypothetical protein [Candidatus Odyssella thessalonicensis]